MFSGSLELRTPDSGADRPPLASSLLASTVFSLAWVRLVVPPTAEARAEMKFFSPQAIQWNTKMVETKPKHHSIAHSSSEGKCPLHLQSFLKWSPSPAKRELQDHKKTHSHQFNHPPSTDSKLIIPAFNYSIRLPLRSLKDGWISGFGVLAWKVGRPLHCDSGG